MNRGSGTLFAIVGTAIIVIIGALFGTGTLNLGTPGGKVIRDPSAAQTPISLTSDVTGVLPQANGGSNASTDFTAGSVIFDDGTRFVQNNANLFWDNTNLALGIGTTTLGTKLEVAGGGVFKGVLTSEGALRTGVLIATTSIDSRGTATSTFLGGISATSLLLTGGLRLDVGDLLVDQKIKAATSTLGELRVNDAAFSDCKQVSIAEFDGAKGNCFEYATTTDGTIEVFGLSGNQPMIIWYYHNDRSGVAFASSSANGITFNFVDGKATTTTENLTKALDQIVIRAIGTSTTEYSVSVIPTFEDMR